MQGISGIKQSEKTDFSHIALVLLTAISALSIIFVGINGLLGSILGVLVILSIPLLFNKPSLFLFFALFIYPFTRFLPLDDKFIITGSLYVLSFPCAIWLMTKQFKSDAKDFGYLRFIFLYMVIIVLNFIRPDSSFTDLLKEGGRAFFAIFTIMATHNYIRENQDSIYKFIGYISYLFNTIAIIALLQYLTKIGGIVNEGIYRVRGTFFNFNDYGYAITIFLCLAFYVLLTSQKHRFYWILTIILNLIALVGTFSKTSILAAALIALTMSMFLPWKIKFRLFISLIVLGGGMFIFLSTSGIIGGLILRFSDTSSLEWRYQMWINLYNMILEGNILFGQGIEASRRYLQFLVPFGESYAPHNVYLETAFDYGIFGFIAFITIFLLVIKKGFELISDKLPSSSNSAVAGTAIIALVAVTLVQNFVSNAFYDRANNIFFWVIITILICCYKYYQPVKRVE